MSEGAPPPTSPADRFLLFDAVARRLLSVATAQPLLVVLEDLHATDDSTLSLLSFVTAHLREGPLLVVGTFRDGEWGASSAAALLARLARDALVIAPGRLTLAEVTRLVAVQPSLAGDEEAIEALYRVSEGNPLFVQEFLRLAAGPNDLHAGSISIPAGVRAAIREHLGRLPDDVRSVLEIASVLGREFTASVLGEVSRRPAAELRHLLASAVERGIVVERDVERWAFGHGLYGDTLHKDLPARRRSELHLAVADALENVGTDDSRSTCTEIAHHLFQAGPEHGERALEAARIAIDDALRRLAFEVAALLARKALAVVPSQDAVRRFAFLRRLAEAHFLSGEPELGKERCIEAADLARSLGKAEPLAEVALTYGLSFTLASTDPVLVHLLEEALAAVGEADSGLRSRLLARLAGALTPSLDSSRPLSLARAAVRMAEQSGDDRTRLEVLHAAGAALTPFAPPLERRRLNEQALPLAARMKQPLIEVRAHLRLVFDHLEAGDVPGSRGHARAYERLAAALRIPVGAWQTSMLRAMYALLEGRSADHDAVMAELSRCEPREPALELALLGHRWSAARAHDDREAFRRARKDLLEYAARNPPPYGTMIAAMLHARVGELDAARATLERTSPDEIVRHENVGMGAYGAEIAWRLGDRAWARPLYEWLVQHEGRMCVIGVAGFACDGSVDHALMLLASTLEDREAARAHHERALAKVRGMDARLLEARIEKDRAEILSQGVPPLPSATLGEAGRPAPPDGPRRVELVRDGEDWLLRGLGVACRMRATRGMEYLAKLLEAHGREVHVLDLAAEGGVVDVGDAGEALDARARTSYRTRASELRAEIDRAEEWNDLGTLERAREELSALEAELRRGLGLGARPRREKQATERARIAVKRRLDDAIRRVLEVSPEVGRHLRATVRTGTRCSYVPERDLPERKSR
jgi:hypothetical protein